MSNSVVLFITVIVLQLIVVCFFIAILIFMFKMKKMISDANELFKQIKQKL